MGAPPRGPLPGASDLEVGSAVLVDVPRQEGKTQLVGGIIKAANDDGTFDIKFGRGAPAPFTSLLIRGVNRSELASPSPPTLPSLPPPGEATQTTELTELEKAAGKQPFEQQGELELDGPQRRAIQKVKPRSGPRGGAPISENALQNIRSEDLRNLPEHWVNAILGDIA